MGKAETAVQTIALIGGTGKEGMGLASAWGRAGYKIIIGSRNFEKAQKAVEAVQTLFPDGMDIRGMENRDAVLNADLAVLTVPFSAHTAILEQLKPDLQEKILIDVTVPLVPPKVTRVQMPPAGSATQEAQQILGEGVEVVAAFQNISYENLLDQQTVDCDVLVCGGSKAARQVVLKLVHDAGLIGWDAGPVENAVVVEGLTSILIGINKQYGVHASGIRITGVPRPDICKD